MENYLISEAIGDIAVSAYEGRMHRIKYCVKVEMLSSRAHITDDTVQTFACAETQGGEKQKRVFLISKKQKTLYEFLLLNSITMSRWTFP